jgi:hypothetical protein
MLFNYESVSYLFKAFTVRNLLVRCDKQLLKLMFQELVESRSMHK